MFLIEPVCKTKNNIEDRDPKARINNDLSNQRDCLIQRNLIENKEFILMVPNTDIGDISEGF